MTTGRSRVRSSARSAAQDLEPVDARQLEVEQDDLRQRTRGRVRAANR